MKPRPQALLLAVLFFLAGGLWSAGLHVASAAAVLVFPCDGSAREQRFLQEQTATWVIQQTRVLAPGLGCVRYRIPLDAAPLQRLQLEANLAPLQLTGSTDGTNWHPLPLKLEGPVGVDQFGAQTADLAAFLSSTSAGVKGTLWLRFQSPADAPKTYLRLRHLRLEVSGAVMPPDFQHPSRMREIAAGAAGPLMILVGVGAVAAGGLRWRVSWRIWAAGAGLWTVSVALKTLFAVLTKTPVEQGLHAILPPTVANWANWGYLGLLTGIFECGIFLLVAPLLRRRNWTWPQALALGTGFGAFEAVAVGLLVSWGTEAAGIWRDSGAWGNALAPAFERLLALIIHVAAVVMILHAVMTRTWRWFWLGFAYKSAMDVVAAWLLLSGATLMASPWRMEWICFAPFAIAGIVLLFWLRRQWHAVAAMPAASPVT